MDPTDRSGGGGALPRPGDVVGGKYRIESVVGSGGMGIVVGAVDTSLARPVAIKFLSPQHASRDGAVARFLREARAAAAIQSEHVVRVFEVSTLPNGAPFIVMEHLRGADLAQTLSDRGAFSIHDACDLLLQACEALSEAHNRGIVHRDLKPQNLFLSHRPDGSPCVKVLDFGISKAADDAAPNLTSTDMVMGTPLYMSPEQVRSLKSVDARADIWALGSILFELLTTSPIYDAPSVPALCAMIAMDPPTPLRARRRDAPAELEQVILRCLQKDPAARFPNVAALADALVPFASERGRLSAARVFSVVRGGHDRAPPAPLSSAPQLAFASAPPAPLAMAPTAYATTGLAAPGPTASGHRASFVPSVSNMPPPGPSQHPGRYPTTQSAWQKADTGERTKRTNGVLVAVLGGLSGLLLLSSAIGGGAWWYLARRDTTAASPTVASPTVPSPTAATTQAGAQAATSAAPTTSSASTKSMPTSSTPPKSTPLAKDGGAPSLKDGGAGPPPAPTPNKDKEEEERNAALGRQAEASCRNHTMQMTTFARDDASRKRAAQQAKTFMCRGSASSRCEREVCKNACMVLGDSGCIRDVQYVIDYGPAPKY